MEEIQSYRPRVSRETRLLLTTALLAVAALWILARIRFPDRPVTPNPVPPLLTQLAVGPTFDDLASQLSQVQARLEPSLRTVRLASRSAATWGESIETIPVLRVRDDLAIGLLSSGVDPQSLKGQGAVGYDAASGLTVIRVSDQVQVPVLAPWSPRRLEQPRYLMASAPSVGRVSLRPVFVGRLEPIESPVWPGPIWLLPERTDVTPGVFLFTGNGELAGGVVSHGSEHAIVPADILFAEVNRLVTSDSQPARSLGIHVQALTQDLSRATGAPEGVIVTRVDEAGAAANLLATADVIEAANGQPVLTPQQWDARVARLTVGDVLSLRIRRRGELHAVKITATAPQSTPANRLGITMRRVPGRGVEVVGVEPQSAGERAGLAPGDVITMAGRNTAPTPGQVNAVFTSASEDRPVLLAVTRGDSHFITALDR